VPVQILLPIARHPFDPTWTVHSLEEMNIKCSFCNALHWRAEALAKSSQINPKFGMCCYEGKISLPSLQKPSTELYRLFVGEDDRAKSFHLHIRNYNNALAMTSVGRKLDDSINQGGGGPYVFKLYGKLIHRVGSLLPLQDENGVNLTPPVYAQLYIYDSSVALDHCMGNEYNTNLEHTILQTLQDVLYNSHPAVPLYQHAFQLTRNIPHTEQYKIALHFDPSTDRRHYQNPDPTVGEIAVILPGDGDQPADSQDIILYCKHGEPLQRISDCHPFYPSLHYILLFPTGQLGWHNSILYNQRERDNRNNEERDVTMAEYFHYCLHIRPEEIESNHLFLAGKLF